MSTKTRNRVLQRLRYQVWLAKMGMYDTLAVLGNNKKDIGYYRSLTEAYFVLKDVDLKNV